MRLCYGKKEISILKIFPAIELNSTGRTHVGLCPKFLVLHCWKFATVCWKNATSSSCPQIFSIHFPQHCGIVHIYTEGIVDAQPITAMVVLFWLTTPSSRHL